MKIKEWKTVTENQDGTFSVSGSDHKNLTPEELEKLQQLQGGGWLVFRDYSKNPVERDPNTTYLSFKDAM